MKSATLAIVATLAAFVAASPVSVSERQIGSITVKRSTLMRAAKRDVAADKAADKVTEDNISDSVNYILKLPSSESKGFHKEYNRRPSGKLFTVDYNDCAGYWRLSLSGGLKGREYCTPAMVNGGYLMFVSYTVLVWGD
ncbi:hypothetical protein Cob_v012302 [Colletotrichum orbiculare MAFF 240422]|uniref:Uncharacterized protein n=1 Tax=Colletotrichum orbiculare (strain 104-T / ATCC 96160 / CBS 514.97 / LARS 414 / MAFF 240422) TaxID=1213857 RepID=A0A484F9M6_COLOR|nr:hypothetical protein Cob_v012302 [Colletotrichum orbiculare MAFF 240422]